MTRTVPPHLPDDRPRRHAAIRVAVAEICAAYPDAYWRELHRAQAYPEALVDALAAGGWLSVLIPREHGGLGLGLAEAGIVLEEINRSGGNGAACHAQMYTMGTLLRHGSADQQRRYLPRIASGELRLLAFSVTEAAAGSETTRIETTAVAGRPVHRQRPQELDVPGAAVRPPAPPGADDAVRRAGGQDARVERLPGRPQAGGGDGQVEIRPVETMLNHQTAEVFYRDLAIPAENLIGEEGAGFRHILDGWNAERILIAAQCIGDGRWFVERAVRYARDRVVFGRPIGQNQGVQFPLAKAHMAVEAADLMRWRATDLFDRGERCGAEANMAKYLAAEASWEAANACLDTHGGLGFVAAHDVERKFRETRLYRVAPVNQNLVLAFVGQHVLGLPKSY